MKNILFVFGTRPEVIKMAPLVREIRADETINAVLCNTGQQRELSRQALDFFDLREDLFLDVMSDNQSLEGVLAKLLSRLKGMLGSLPVDGILVQGDTITAYAGALVAYFNKIPLFSFGGRVKIFESFRTHAGRGLKADD